MLEDGPAEDHGAGACVALASSRGRLSFAQSLFERAAIFFGERSGLQKLRGRCENAVPHEKIENGREQARIFERGQAQVRLILFHKADGKAQGREFFHGRREERSRAEGAAQMVESHALIPRPPGEDAQEPIRAVRIFSAGTHPGAISVARFFHGGEGLRGTILAQMPKRREIVQLRISRKSGDGLREEFFGGGHLPKAQQSHEEITNGQGGVKLRLWWASLPEAQQGFHAAARRGQFGK